MAMSTDTTKQYIPSQMIIDPSTGEKWRLCAGVAVLNSKNQILVGERHGKPDQWQCPQGGVDDEWTDTSNAGHPLTTKPKETIVQAAIRELHEETGLIIDRHVILDSTFPIPSTAGDGDH
eukprot:CAMPEP_0170321240 /NCGR_PEP_ID=MMETSP0116_2-20130129/61376_1 /TAXON_ID=400756 /ORGANISM="Durinskia baltica, Strain CSIRO CS-38" /LENGTH=119 /DNA_ID=CAMNT_0010574055 /DNA_START=6 /DNA_END=362 /DNA_ORIENTATION=-